MQTLFSSDQLQSPRIQLADEILRKCVHCGFCTATCPTFVLTGDELDSPRGRIYQIKDMFENGGQAGPEITKHLDRCLSCLSCMTTCPSGVHYMHLVDEARAQITETHRRPVVSRLIRNILALVLPYPARFRAALAAARLARPFSALLEKLPALEPLAAMLKLAPAHIPEKSTLAVAGVHKANGQRRGRVALMTGCANSVLGPSINEATIRVLQRAGYDVVISPGAGCCGSLEHHLGMEDGALDKVRCNVDAWWSEIDGKGLDAIIINASGCGTTVKDYGHMLRLDAAYGERAKAVSERARDISQFLAQIELGDFTNRQNKRVAYHAACSLQHGQKITTEPKALLQRAGFDVVDIAEGHLCCGSAGVYNILQAGFAEQLKKRKLKNIARTGPDIVATGNIGCITQLESGAGVPVVHTVELLDWAQGGPKPPLLA